MTVAIRERTSEPLVAPRVVRFVWTSLLVVLGALPLLYAFASPRSIVRVPSPIFGVVDPRLTQLVQSWSSLLQLGIAFGILVLALPVVRMPRRGVVSAAIGLAALGVAVMISGVINSVPPRLGLLAMPLTVGAMVLFPRPSLAWFERKLLLLLRGYVWGSLAAAVVLPTWAVQHDYDSGILPPIGSRLAGITPHPNALGPLAVALVVLEWHRRPRSPLAISAAVVVLVWTQSKTSWAALAAIVVISLAGRLPKIGQRPPVRHLLVLALMLGATVSIAVGLAAPERATARDENSADTFTGRTAIWEVTLEVWQENRLVGYGPRLWDDAMYRTYRHRVGFQPGHSHNQLVHTLGEAGLIGAAALVACLVLLSALARSVDGQTAGTATSLFVLLVVQCFSTAPLQSVAFGTSFLLTLGTFGYLVVAAGEGAGAGASASSSIVTRSLSRDSAGRTGSS